MAQVKLPKSGPIIKSDDKESNGFKQGLLKDQQAGGETAEARLPFRAGDVEECKN